ncbi:hypothetical protein BGI23_23965 [Bacillus sp. ABP14]|nr:helix-turn-helix domain-containing protein [Bacillus sp. ABP14]AOY18214.1 hypothetical protein BGI23_23965 [Bacillus sp. ABP14]
MGSLYNLMKPYSEFRSKEEFNTYQKQVLKHYRFQLNKTDATIIHFLGKYAVNEKQKTVGVACPLMETIATNVGKSIRTVRDLFLEVGLEWGAALRRSKGIPLFDPFKKEPCV